MKARKTKAKPERAKVTPAADAGAAQQEEKKAPRERSVEKFCRDTGIAVSAYYLIPRELRPTSVAIGRRVVILEGAEDWLKRMAERGGVTLAPSKKAASA